MIEDILLDTVVLANFEYYSASARRFQVLGSNSYPCEHWALLGEFETNNTRQEQVFEIPNPMWVRYLKFRFLTVHGTSHYWSLSLVRAHGQTHIDKFKSDNSRLEEVKNGIRSDMAEAFGAEGEEGAGGGEEGEEVGEGAADDANEGQGEGQGEGTGAAEAGEVEDSAKGAAMEAAPAAADGEAPSANGAVEPVERGETGAAAAADGTAPDKPAKSPETALPVGAPTSASDTPTPSDTPGAEANLAAVPSEECVRSDAGLEEGIEPSQVEAAADPTEVPADGSAVEAGGEAASQSVRPPTEALGDGGASDETDAKPALPPVAASANATQGAPGGAEGQARAETPQRGAGADSPTEEPGPTAPLAALADAALAAAAAARSEPASSEPEAARSTADAGPELAVPPLQAAEPAETPGQAARREASGARESAPARSSEPGATEREPSADVRSTGASTGSPLERAGRPSVDDASHHAHPVAAAETEPRAERHAELRAEHSAELEAELRTSSTPTELADAASDEGCAAVAATAPSGEAGSSTPSSSDGKVEPEAAPGSGAQNTTEGGIVSRTARAVACALGGCQPPPVTPTKGPLETSPPPPPPPPLADPPSALATPPPPPMPARGTFPSPPLPSPTNPPRRVSSSASVVAPPPSPPGRPARAAAESHTRRTGPSDNGPGPETHREPSPAVPIEPSPESTPAPEPLPVPRADLGVPAVPPTPLPEPASSSVVSSSVVSAADSPAPTASTASTLSRALVREGRAASGAEAGASPTGGPSTAEDAGGGSADAPEPTGQQQQQQLTEPSATPKASASAPAVAQPADGKPNEASREAPSGTSALVAAEGDSPSSGREARAPVANGSATGAATPADGGAEGETRATEGALFIGPISPGAVAVVAKGAAAAPAAAAPNVPLPPSQAAALRAANDPNNIFSALTKRMGTLEINQTLINTWISLWEGQISAKLKNLSAMQNATHTKLRTVQANVSTTQERMTNLTSSLGIERLEQVALQHAEARPPPPPSELALRPHRARLLSPNPAARPLTAPAAPALRAHPEPSRARCAGDHAAQQCEHGRGPAAAAARAQRGRRGGAAARAARGRTRAPRRAAVLHAALARPLVARCSKVHLGGAQRPAEARWPLDPGRPRHARARARARAREHERERELLAPSGDGAVAAGGRRGGGLARLRGTAAEAARALQRRARLPPRRMPVFAQHALAAAAEAAATPTLRLGGSVPRARQRLLRSKRGRPVGTRHGSQRAPARVEVPV